MTTTPPGWYDDGHGALRWWDGSQWTEHVAQPDPEASEAPTEAEIVAAQLGFGGGEPAATAGTAGPDAPAQPVTAAPAATAAAPGAASVASPGYAAGAPAQAVVPAATPPYAGQPQPPYPGGAPAGGAFTAATEPRRSKLWIVWVVLGVVLLGVVIAAAVLIPLLILSASTSGGSAQSDDERSAVAAVELFDEAYQQGDCDALAEATTEEFRAANGFDDCAAFQEQAAAFNAALQEYEIEVTDVETVADVIVVTTTESYSEVGEDAEPTPGSAVYEYTVVDSGGAWLVDDVAGG
ncbi:MULTISPECIES: DUF2510 domain-containing protein [unclassified Microbacterium]|uniref:DUF2510 domain-containing protein n=1 Tax=unclassified Microbacterium TaxID=2609290 RepID=UPI0030104377